MRKQLAEVMFPNTESREHWEEVFKEREYGVPVTRFAPSPTGSVHIGSLFASLIAERLAHKDQEGVCYLRIEDTDQKREVEGATEGIIDVLSKYGINFDEGMISSTEWEGEHGSYKQSDWKAIFNSYAKWMVENDLAYPCFLTKEEIDDIKIHQRWEKAPIGIHGKWAKYRDLNPSKAIDKIKAGESYIVRLKSPTPEGEDFAYFEDLVVGEYCVESNRMDIPIIKADGLPTYHFAHVICDHLQGTTLVSRGIEWLPSTPIHLQLFEVLGWEAPEYLHFSSIMKLDEETKTKRKLSKRKDPEADVNYYLQQGYPTLAVTEYLMTLINSNFEDWRMENPDAPYTEFEVEVTRMSNSGTMFDLSKLNFISKGIIQKMTAEEMGRGLLAYAKAYEESKAPKIEANLDKFIKFFNIDKGTNKGRKDYATFKEMLEKTYYLVEANFQANLGEEQKLIVKEYIQEFKDKNIATSEEWFDELKYLSKKLNYTDNRKEYKKNPSSFKGFISEVANAIRLSLTGRTATPDLFSIIDILGQEETIKRLGAVC